MLSMRFEIVMSLHKTMNKVNEEEKQAQEEQQNGSSSFSPANFKMPTTNININSGM